MSSAGMGWARTRGRRRVVSSDEYERPAPVDGPLITQGARSTAAPKPADEFDVEKWLREGDGDGRIWSRITTGER